MKSSDSYFSKLNTMLQQHERALPSILIDLDRLDANLAQLELDLNPSSSLRIVVKSLPSWKLLSYVMTKTGSKRLMVFHQPFLSDLTTHLDGQANVLLGKPMPIRTAEYYYNNLPECNEGFNPFTQIQWLVDTEHVINQYIVLAKRLKRRLGLNMEIDVGLHRGGFNNLPALNRGLDLIRKNQDFVHLTGFMGYDPHVVKIPKLLRSTARSLALSSSFYDNCKSLLRKSYPELWGDELIFNGAGSPTFGLHNNTASPLNDISVGSCLVKPTTFDIPTLTPYMSACFIAAPVLKKCPGTTIPGLEKCRRILSFGANQCSYFIYGGYWKAEYCYPKGLKQNSMFGPSTNQTMLNAPKSSALEVGDFVFLRPHQSEFVFLQFGELLTFRNGQIGDRWKPLDNSM